MNLKKVPKWAWVVAALVAVGVWWYLHKSSSSVVSPAQGSGVDDNQLANDLASQLEAAGIGGSPDPNANLTADQEQLLAELQSLIDQSQAQAGQVVSDGSSVFVNPNTSTPDSQSAVTNPGGSQVAPQFIVPAAPNSAGIGYIANPSSPTPQVYSPSGQNLTGYVGVLGGSPNITPSRTGPARAM